MRYEPGKLLDGTAEPLIGGVTVDGEPFDALFISVAVVHEDKAGHRPPQRKIVLVHEPAVLVHEIPDCRPD